MGEEVRHGSVEYYRKTDEEFRNRQGGPGLTAGFAVARSTLAARMRSRSSTAWRRSGIPHPHAIELALGEVHRTPGRKSLLLQEAVSRSAFLTSL